MVVCLWIFVMFVWNINHKYMDGMALEPGDDQFHRECVANIGHTVSKIDFLHSTESEFQQS